MKSLANQHSSLYINQEWKNSGEFEINYSELKSLYMKAKPLISKSNNIFAPLPLHVSFYFQKSFVNIKNAVIVDLTNTTGEVMLANLNLFFQITEEPIFSEMTLTPESCSHKRIKIFTRPHKSKAGDGSLHVLMPLEIQGEHCKVHIPFFHKHKSFDDLDSDHLVYYVVPGAFADYVVEGKAQRVGFLVGL